MDVRLEGEQILYETPDDDMRSFSDVQESAPEETPNPNIEQRSLAPEAAFEVFMGKRFDPLAGSARSAADRVGLFQADAGKAPTVGSNPSSVLESPLERLTRLKLEVAQLTDDLKAISAAKRQDDGKTDGPATEEAPSDVWKGIRQEAEAVFQQLQEVATTPEFKPLLEDSDANAADGVLTVQGELSRKLVKEVQKITQSQSLATADDPAAPSVSYELLYHPAVAAAGRAASSGASRPELSDLEKRLAKLEAALGADAVGETAPESVGKNVQPLVQRVQQLEQGALGLADERRLRQLDAEAARARSSLQALEQQRTSKAAVDAEHLKRVQGVFEKMQQWEAMAADLPVLAARLRILQDLHTQSADFAQRLHQLEAGSEGVTHLLKNDEALLKKVEEGMVENMKKIEQNVKFVDEKIASVLNK
eukprot:CAMPEP_0113942116 /NCGR_PEP_ID=MMETSP1339-20121228/7889_1 /TAXON_ID=94617 /ORGANISM="Fibrocapsa japonica" /LENGTH=421 /DNA_ID=CAMNT_0000946457 /DNA_START=28 /DNA_END=1293 /DNA_ORIENTATION=+ /assembly_acc=CAM_ASM_000762